MNYLLKNPVSIDDVINSVQKEMYPMFQDRWCSNINGYGRIYKNEYNNGVVKIERHVVKDDYEDVAFDDNFAGNFFFMDSNLHKSSDNLVFTTEVKCVFMVNLRKLFNNKKERPDERAHRDAVEILREISDERYTISGIQKGVRDIFIGIDKSQLIELDLNPLHVFAVVLDLSYYLNDKCD